MQKIIIFEGADMSGKSTIAKALSERLNWPIWKMHTEKKFWDPIIAQRYSQEVITQFAEQTKLSVIFDRSFVSDYMYAKLFNRHYDYLKAKETDQRFANMNTLIVFCYKDKEKYQHDEEDKEFVSISDYEKMENIYNEYLLNTKCNNIMINTSDENLEEQLAIIIKEL